MKAQSSIYMDRGRHDWCVSLIDSGEWDTFSAEINYMLRLYLETLQRERPSAVPRLMKSEIVRVEARIDVHVSEELLKLGLFERSIMYDYAVENYRSWLEGRSLVRSSPSSGIQSMSRRESPAALSVDCPTPSP